MEEDQIELKPIHSDSATSAISTAKLPNSPPSDDPTPEPPSTAADGGIEIQPKKNKSPEEPEGEGEEKDPAEAARVTTTTSNKRRKLCPSALEKCESIILNSCSANSSNSFSFTFDPKYSSGVSTPEVTPKFGSFNLVPDEAANPAEIGVKSEQEGGGEKRANEDRVEEEHDNFLEILGSGDDGGISAVDFFEDGSNLFL